MRGGALHGGEHGGVGSQGPAWRAHVLAAGVSAILPAWLVGDTLRPFMTPGVEGEALWRSLQALLDLRAGRLGAWSEAPLPTWVAALLPLDGPLSHGVVVALGSWLTGYGVWRLAQVRAGAGAWVCAAAALLAETSPLVLRGIPQADLAALGAGALALALASPRHAWWAGLWSLPVSVALCAAGILRVVGERSKEARGEAGQLLLGGMGLLGAMIVGGREGTPGEAIAPAYVAENGALFALPEAEAAPVRESALASGTGTWLAPGVMPRVRGNRFAPRGPGEQRGEGHVSLEGDVPEELPAWGSLLVPLQRLHGGAGATLGLLAGLWALRGRARGVAAAGLLAAALLVAGFGWQAAPGEIERGGLASEALRGGWAGADRSALLSWSVVPLTLGALGWSAWLQRLWQAGGRSRGVAFGAGALVVAVGVALENPRLVTFRVMVPPDPALAVLRQEEPGDVLVFPPPPAPWHAGSVAEGRLRVELAMVGRRLAAPGVASDAALRALAARSGVPVDIQAAQAAWESREWEPFGREDLDGWRWLVLDTGSLPPEAGVALDGWLASQLGVPVARGPTRVVYDRLALTRAPAGGPPPGMPSPGMPSPGMRSPGTPSPGG